MGSEELKIDGSWERGLGTRVEGKSMVMEFEEGGGRSWIACECVNGTLRGYVTLCSQRTGLVINLHATFSFSK